MIETDSLNSDNFKKIFEDLEEQYLSELEELLVNRLMEEKSVTLPDAEEEVLEFAGKTNYKIRFRRPNKNVWSVSLQEFRESLRKVLREGHLIPLSALDNKKSAKNSDFELPTLMLLHILPAREYEVRSFVGNKVVHPTMGEGEVVHISDTGNVEVKFEERVVMLKPGFVKLQVA